MKAIRFAIKSYYKKWAEAKHLTIRSDNTTATAYINNVGRAISDNCNNLAKDNWKFCIKGNVWISAEYIPGSENYIDDFYVRRHLMTIQNDSFPFSYFKK